MPELPEVETVCRQLQAALVSRRLRRWNCFDPKLHLPALSRSAPRVVHSVWRSGKQIVIEFRDEKGRATRRPTQASYLVVHLRMTGRLLWKAAHSKPQKTSSYVRATGELKARATFEFEDGVLIFADTRRFGTLQIFSDPNQFKPVGCDPMLDALSNAEFYEQYIRRTHQPLKLFLMRQDKLVGVGNIYASEILFDARLSPLRITSTLTAQESATLLRSTRRILQRAIDAAGTTFSDFQDTNGAAGGGQKLLRVYEREGKRCFRCRAYNIERIVQGQRSTYYCAGCQLK